VGYRGIVARTIRFSQVLWLMTTAWLAACGRLGFDTGDHGAGGVPDAAGIASELIDAPGALTLMVTSPPITSRCGNAPGTFSIMVQNTSSRALSITSADLVTTNPTMGQVFAVQSGFPLSIDQGAVQTIEVVPPMAIVGTDSAKAVKTAMLTLHLDDATTVTVPLSSTVVGANLEITAPAANPPSLAFTSSSGNCPINTRQVTVLNAGNADVNVTLVASALHDNFVTAGSGFTAGTIGAGASVVTSFLAFSSGACAGSGTVSYDLTPGFSGLCTTEVINVTLSVTDASTACLCGGGS
jgi:hypothetical protein